MKYTTGTVSANGVQLHYYRTGGEKPPLVLVHGITDDGLCWAPVAGQLSGEYDVVMVDLRGHGKSEAPESGYTLANLATDLAAFVQSLELKRPIFLGHSLGAIATLVLAGMYPDIPRAILLEDPPAFWRPKGPDPRTAKLLQQRSRSIETIKRMTRDDLMAECQRNHPGWTAEEKEHWADAKQRYSPHVAALMQPPDIVSIDFPRLMRRVACPALFLSADPRLGAVATQDDIALLKEWIQQLQVVHIDYAGHSIRRDQAERYRSAVQAFLSGLS